MEYTFLNNLNDCAYSKIKLKSCLFSKFMFVSKQKKKGRSCKDRKYHRLGDTSLVSIVDVVSIKYSKTISFFRIVNKRAGYPFGIISLAHAPMNVTDFSIGSINCVRHFPQT